MRARVPICPPTTHPCWPAARRYKEGDILHSNAFAPHVRVDPVLQRQLDANSRALALEDAARLMAAAQGHGHPGGAVALATPVAQARYAGEGCSAALD